MTKELSWEKEFEEIWYTKSTEKPTEGWEFAYSEKVLNAEHLGDVGKLVSETKEFIRSTLAKREKKALKFGYNKGFEDGQQPEAFIAGMNEVAVSAYKKLKKDNQAGEE